MDDLHGDLINDTGQLSEWAWALVRNEAEDLHMAREWLSSAVVAHHHGAAGRRPDTIFGGICYDFSAGPVDLTLPEPFRGQNAAHPGGVVVHTDTPPASGTVPVLNQRLRADRWGTVGGCATWICESEWIAVVVGPRDGQ